MTRIRTTDTGSFRRPQELEVMIVATRRRRARLAGFERGGRRRRGRRPCVGRPRPASTLNDGEQGKQGYSTYVQDRLTGSRASHSASATSPNCSITLTTARTWPRWMQTIHVKTPACTGPVRLKAPRRRPA